MGEKKLRFWENLVVLGGIVLFVRGYLVSATHRFNADVDTLVAGGADASIINSYQDQYHHFWNTILPVSLMALLAFVAWYVFHHYAYPQFRRGQSTGISYLFFTLTLLLAGYYIHQHLRLYWQLSGFHVQFPDAFHFFKRTRRVSLLGNTLVYLWLIFLYEVLSQAFYKVCRNFRKEGPMYDLLINFLFAFSVLVFLSGMVALGYSQYAMRDLLPGLYAMVMVVGVVFAQDYFTRNLLLRKGKASTWNAVFVVISICFFSALVIETLNAAFRDTHDGLVFRLITTLPDTSLAGLFMAVLALAAGASRYLLYRQQNLLETQVNVKSAELDQLRAQVNPHFLFNALNTLYSVALRENAETTAGGIQKLGDMMRFMLNENHQDLISIAKEVEQLENYIEIQRMRIDESHDIRITVHLQQPESSARIAPMVLNPFVENAFKHGISLLNPSWIHITLTFDAENLYFKVHNSLHTSREADPEKYNNGIGLENVKRRLNLLYPRRHTLTMEQSEQDFFVSLTLKY